MKDLIKTTKIIILALTIAVGVSYVSAWVGPTDTAPAGNASAPINVGAASQYKAGALGVGGIFRSYTNAIFDGTIVGANRFDVNYPTSNVYDNTTSDSPYSRVDADSFHTNGLGVGQIFIEGRAIDSNTWIGIGAGLAGGQTGKDVKIGNDNEVYVDTSTNRVGIGTTAPLQKLDVRGNVVADNLRNVKCATDELLVGFDANGDLICEGNYSWSIGAWGACGSPQVTTHNQIVYDGSDGCGQKIRKESTTTTSRSRSVLCKSGSGQTVSDSFCTTTKPITSRACSTKIRYRGLFNDMHHCGGGAGPIRWYKGLDTRAGTYSWSIRYYDHGYKTRTGSGAKASGATKVNTGVVTHQGSGWTNNYFDLTLN